MTILIENARFLEKVYLMIQSSIAFQGVMIYSDIKKSTISVIEGIKEQIVHSLRDKNYLAVPHQNQAM